LYTNAEVFDTLPEKDEIDNIPQSKFNSTPPERERNRSRDKEGSRTRNVLRKINENKSLKKDFESVNEEVKENFNQVEEFMKKFKSQKEKSKERNHKIKCLIKSKNKERSNETLQLVPPNQNQKSGRGYKNSESLPEGDFEETRNLNDELNKILNRINSGSQIVGGGSQYSVESNYKNRVKSSHRENNQKGNEKNEVHLGKVPDYYNLVI
jgi:hypothetical protein